MEREELIAKLIEFASMAFEVPEEDIREDTDIAEELGVQSMQRIAMAASIENDFDVVIPVARFADFRTIGDLADYILDEM